MSSLKKVKKQMMKGLADRYQRAFKEACNHPTPMGQLTVNRGGGLWTHSQQWNVNPPLDFLECIDPKFINAIKAGPVTTAAQLQAGTSPSWKVFVVQDPTNGKPLILGRWWAMRGDEFSKLHNHPLALSADDIVVCDIDSP